MNLLKLLTVSLIVFLIFGCAEKKPVALKEFEAEDLQDFISKMKNYNFIESSLNIQYEAKNSVLTGDALLRITEKELLLRVYYMGFPAGELYEESGEVSSTLLIEKDRLKQLALGIRKAFIWWNGDFSIEEDENYYILKEKDGRTVLLSKAGFMPVKQTLNIDGQSVLINYDAYNKITTENGTVLNMPSNIVVYYKNRTLKIKVEKIKLKSEP
ncbi:hypothetical protein [Thermodesulfovibrio hydrogeniphilus]